jgi:hypothetical protein
MHKHNLLLLLLAGFNLGLVAMSDQEKLQFRADVQAAKTTEEMEALVEPFMGTVYKLDLAFDNEKSAFFLGRKRLLLPNLPSTNADINLLMDVNVLNRAQDARAILDECLFQDLDSVLNSAEAQTSNPVPTMSEKCTKYTWTDASLENTLRGLCSALRADQHSPQFKQLEMVQKAITAAKNKKPQESPDDAREDSHVPSKLNLRAGKYALCTVVGLVAIYGIYRVLFAKKKKAAASEEDENDLQAAENSPADAKTVDA